MLLIGFGNKARHGKDTACEAIADHYNALRERSFKHGLISKEPRVQQFRFAEALYDEARTLYGMIGKDAPLLQRIGSERRAQDEYYWVKQVFNQIERSQPDIALISDVRYLNEANFIKGVGGYLVNVARLNADGTPFVADDRPANHPSEVELDEYNWDYRIIAHTGEAAVVGEVAVTIVEYLRGLHV